MTSRQYIRVVSQTGGNPDPATYCPANDYTAYPFTAANGWSLLMTVQTNSPNTTTFDPTITASSGEYGWDFGDGSLLVGDKGASHVFLVDKTYTVKLYGRGTCNITGINMTSDHLIGNVDLSNAAFNTLTSIDLSSNLTMTGITTPATTGAISSLQLYSTGIQGVLDLSKFTTFGTSATIYLYNNTTMTGVNFASSITGTISALVIYSTGIQGVLDLSKFTSFGPSASIQLFSNPSMTGVTFANSISGTISQLYIYLTGIIGVIDLSKFTTFTTSASIRLHTNPSMTGVTFASSITGTITQLQIYVTGIIGVLDLSMFNSFTTSASIQLQSNASMTGVNFASSISSTSRILTLLMRDCTSLGYVSLLAFTNGTAINSSNIEIQNNRWTADIVNHMLVDLNTISVSGYTGRSILIGGTNAAPNATSGDYDGLTAKSALITKVFTVGSN